MPHFWLDNLFCANLKSLLLGGGEIFLLAYIGQDANDLILLVQQPLEDATSVQATGVSQNYGFLRHISRMPVHLSRLCKKYYISMIISSLSLE